MRAAGCMWGWEDGRCPPGTSSESPRMWVKVFVLGMLPDVPLSACSVTTLTLGLPGPQGHFSHVVPIVESLISNTGILRVAVPAQR